MKVKGWGASSAPGMRRLDCQPNEDVFLALEAPGIFAAIDGMGGHRRGELAAKTVAARIAAGYLTFAAATSPRSAVARRLAEQRGRLPEVAIGAASAAIIDMDPVSRGRMGATIALLDVEAGAIAWCGDARAYLLYHGGVQHLTIDHSPYGEDFAEGRIDFEAYKARSTPVVTRHVGADGDAGRASSTKIDTPGRYLLLSDGLLVLDETTIATILHSSEDPKVAAKALTEAALMQNGQDDITAVVVDLEE